MPAVQERVFIRLQRLFQSKFCHCMTSLWYIIRCPALCLQEFVKYLLFLRRGIFLFLKNCSATEAGLECALNMPCRKNLAVLQTHLSLEKTLSVRTMLRLFLGTIFFTDRVLRMSLKVLLIKLHQNQAVQLSSDIL